MGAAVAPAKKALASADSNTSNSIPVHLQPYVFPMIHEEINHWEGIVL